MRNTYFRCTLQNGRALVATRALASTFPRDKFHYRLNPDETECICQCLVPQDLFDSPPSGITILTYAEALDLANTWDVEMKALGKVDI